MKEPLYIFLRPIIRVLMKSLFRIEYVNQKNIPKNGSYILVGNHKSNFDCATVIASCNRVVHFLAKKELLDSKLGFFFKWMGIIPVNRKTRNKEAMNSARDVLNNKGVIGIFPEGTFNKTEYVIMPFKMGTVKLAFDTKASIVPFAIVGDYKLFRKTKIIFGKPYKIKTMDLKGENITLMNKVIRLMRNEYNRED